jgi:adenosylcobinamide-GDP ribazoletransferase
MMGSFITAFRTLTIIPLPGKDTPVFSRSLVIFPVVGAFIALCEYGIMIAGEHSLPKFPVVTAFFMVLAGVLLTGAIHCDGLADFCDGFFGGKTKDQILSIMKDPRTGSFGVVALIMDLGFRFLACYILISGKAFFVIAFSLVISRTMQSFCIAFLPYARNDGGTAAPFFGTKSLKWIAASVCVVSYFISSMFSGFLVSGMFFGAGIVVTAIFCMFCFKKINGVTGDCIGACSEFVETCILICGLFLV